MNKNYKLSIAITVCNEFIEIQKLMTQLLFDMNNKLPNTEIVVLQDMKVPTSEYEVLLLNDITNYLDRLYNFGFIKLHRTKFNGNFSDLKNELFSYCTGDFILNLDADELLSDKLHDNLLTIIDTTDSDVFLFARENKVEGITNEYIKQWGWVVDEQLRINYPDWQKRMLRNNKNIKWQGSVHETLIGFETYCVIPMNAGLDILHYKTIDKQIKQNNLYSGIN